MKRALITGGAGFIGYHLVSYLLKKKYLIKIIDKFPIYYQNNNLKNFKKPQKNKNYKLIPISQTKKPKKQHPKLQLKKNRPKSRT